MTTAWRMYCLKCDELGETVTPGDPIPEPSMHKCGRMVILVSGVFVKQHEEYRVGELLRAH